MERYGRTDIDPEPWIEQMIQNYGKCQHVASLRAHVVGVSDLSESLRVDENGACVLMLSDGTVMIPAILSASGWETMQDLEEMEEFSSLDNTTVSLQQIHLNFHMDSELTSCQFYLSVNQIFTVGRVTRHYRPPSCTALQSVKQQILKTWRSQMKESSVNSVNSQSGFGLSSLMGAWHNDIIMDLMNDAIEKITITPVSNPGVTTPTIWHRDRLLFRGEDCFSAPVSHLLIPEEQRELLTADPAASSETSNGSVLPLADITTNQPVITRDEKRDSPTVAFDRPADGDQPNLEHTQPEIWSGGGGGACGERASPWDMFCPASDMLGTSSSLENLASKEPLSQEESHSLLRVAPQVPLATSTQARATNPNTGRRSGITPYQKPHPSLPFSTYLIDKTTTQPTKDVSEEQQVLSPPTWIIQNTAWPSQQKSPVVPPFKKYPPESPPPKKGRVHSDGSRFSYTYEPCTLVSSALAKFDIQEQLVQWAVSYLGTRHQVSAGVELEEVEMQPQRTRKSNEMS